MDWSAVATALGTPLASIALTDGTKLRSPNAVPPDDIVCPTAVVMPPTLSAIEWTTAGVSGTATHDVLVLLDPASDLPRRSRALLAWLGPALAAYAPHVLVGLGSSISGVQVTGAACELAGSSPVYADLPYDLIRLTVSYGWRDSTVAAP